MKKQKKSLYKQDSRKIDLLKEVFCLGLDISQRNCGIYLIPISLDISLCRYKTLDLGERLKYPGANEEALHILYSSLISFCLGKCIAVTCIEDHAFDARHSMSLAFGAERVGVAKLICSKFLGQDSLIVPVASGTVVKFAANGHSKRNRIDRKEKIQKGLVNLKILYDSQHTADAAMLALIGVFLVRNNRILSKNKKEVITNLRKKYAGELKKLFNLLSTG